MQVQFTPVASEEQIQYLSVLADKVWHECFLDIISTEQIDYMVEKFQSYRALKKQIKEGYEYFLIMENKMPVGYTGIYIEPDRNTMFVSKIYLLKEFRGKGYASEAFAFLEGLCLGMQIKSMYLTVNRNNAHAIQVYKKKGFETIRTQVTDIGGGFVMDDYVMEKILIS